MKNEKEYIFAYTVSGEGYSSPQFKAFTKEFDAKLHLKQYISANSEGNKLIKQGNNDFVIEIGDGEDTDYHRLQIIEVGKADYHLVYATEPNEVKVLRSFKEKSKALLCMSRKIFAQRWEREEEVYDSGNFYGAHTSEGAYIHYEIVSATKPLVEVLEDEPAEKHIHPAIEALEHIINRINVVRKSDRFCIALKHIAEEALRKSTDL